MKTNHIFRHIAAMVLVVCMLFSSSASSVKAEPMTVKSIEVNGITRPIAGQRPDTYSISISQDKLYQLYLPVKATLQYILDEVYPNYSGEILYDQSLVNALDPYSFLLWYKSSDQSNWKLMSLSETFENGYYYMAKAFIYFPDYVRGEVPISEKVLPVYLDGSKNAGGSYTNGGELPFNGGSVQIVFDDLAIKTLSVFGIDEVVEPVAGEKPNYSSAYLYSKSCSIVNSKRFWFWMIDNGKAHSGIEYYKQFNDAFFDAMPDDSKLMWYQSTNGEDWDFMINKSTGEVSTFEYDHYYKVELDVEVPEKGYSVSPYAYGYINSSDQIADFSIDPHYQINYYLISYNFGKLTDPNSSGNSENNETPQPSEQEGMKESQEIEINDLRFTAPSGWTLDESQKEAGEILLYHGKNEEDAKAVLKLQELEASKVEKNVEEGASLSAIAYEYMKNHAAAEGRKFKMHYALPEYEMNGLTIFKAVGILLKDTDNENSYSIADCSEERPFTQYVVVKVGDQYYVMYFINNESNFMDQIAFDELLSTLQDMKNLSIRLEGQEFSNIMGYLQAARYAYGLDEQGNKLYSNVLEIRNLNRKPINTNAVFNIYGTDENGQEYLIKSGLKFYGLMGDRWWLNAGQEEITRVEFTEVNSVEAGNAVKSTLKANGDGSVLTIAAESAFNAKDVQIMLGADQFWDYPDSGSGTEIDLSPYKDKLEPWQDYSAFTVNVIVYNK